MTNIRKEYFLCACAFAGISAFSAVPRASRVVATNILVVCQTQTPNWRSGFVSWAWRQQRWSTSWTQNVEDIYWIRGWKKRETVWVCCVVLWAADVLVEFSFIMKCSHVFQMCYRGGGGGNWVCWCAWHLNTDAFKQCSKRRRGYLFWRIRR